MRAKILAAGLIWWALLSGQAGADELQVFATGVYATSLRDLVAPFKAETGHDLHLTIGNAGVVAAKIEAGAPADVVMSSSTSIDALARHGKIASATKRDIGRMRLGVGIRAGTPLPDLTSIDHLRAQLLAAPAIAYIDPKGGATAGAFFEKMFEGLGIADAVHAKAILCGDGADVVAALASGRASLGMTQGSEIIGAPGVAFAGFLPDALNTVTIYSVALSTAPAAPAAAEAFVHFMQGPIGGARLKQAGWDLKRDP